MWGTKNLTFPWFLDFRTSRNLYLSTNMHFFKQYKKLMDAFLKIAFLQIRDSWILKSLETPRTMSKFKNVHVCCLKIWKFDISKMWKCENTVFVFLSFSSFGYLIFYQNLWRWALGNDEDWVNEISKIMDMNFISIKKTWNGNLVNPTNFSIFK